MVNLSQVVFEVQNWEQQNLEVNKDNGNNKVAPCSFCNNNYAIRKFHLNTNFFLLVKCMKMELAHYFKASPDIFQEKSC